MSSGGFALSSGSTISVKNENRRAFSSIPSTYDGPMNRQTRRRSPSPGLTRRCPPYEVPPPNRPRASSYRGDYSNNYRPNSWRPDDSAYYNRSLSPDHYDIARPSSSTENWERRGPWPPFSSSSLERRPIQRCHRETLATPMFEPSDAWKQTHNDGPIPSDGFRMAPERHPDIRNKNSRNMSPGKSSFRTAYESPYNATGGGDRYRPSYREPYAQVRSGDSYRPRYDEKWGQSIPHDNSPPRSFKREPSLGYSTFSGHRPPSLDRSSSRTPPRVSSRISAPYKRQSTGRGNRSFSDSRYAGSMERPAPRFNDGRPLRKKLRSRSSSRSSIGSRGTTFENFTQRTFANSYRPAPSRPLRPGLKNAMLQSRPRIQYNAPSSAAQKRPGFRNEDNRLEVKEQRTPIHHPDSRSASPATSIASSYNEEFDYQALKTKECVRPAELTPPTQPSGQLDVQPNDPDTPPANSTPTPLDQLDTSSDPSIARPPAILSPQPANSPLEFKSERQQAAVNGTHPPSSPLTLVEQPSVDMEDTPLIPPDESELEVLSLNHAVRDSVGSDLTAVENQDDLPSMSDATSISEALRIVVMTRLRCDHQTREERVNPVLMANLSIAEPPSLAKTTPPVELVPELLEGNHLLASKSKFTSAKPSLLQRFAKHKATLEEKKLQLKEEYFELHGRWLEHCNRLNSSSRTDTQEETVAPSGRTTRRSTAMLGDAVRTDLEMEQLMAILGSEDHTDPNIISQRNLAIIPDMISVARGHVEYLFDDTNNRVDNPSEFYGPNTGLHDWTAKEKEIFLQRFAAHPKQFGVIADGLPNKTAAQCVDYYYLHKKTVIDFRKVMAKYAPGKRRGRKADKYRGGGLLADIRQHDDEMHRHGNASISNGPTTRRRRILPITNAAPKKPISSRRSAVSLEHTPMSTPTPDPEPYMPQRGRRVNATAVKLYRDDGEEDGTDVELKPAKRGRKRKSKPVSVTTMLDDDDPAGKANIVERSESTTRRKPVAINVHWSDDDKSVFLSLLGQYGDDFKRIAASMPNKTTIQVSNYYKSNLEELNLDKVAARAPKRSPTPEPSRDDTSSQWRELSHYPGSGIMSPVTDTSRRAVSSVKVDTQFLGSNAGTTASHKPQRKATGVSLFSFSPVPSRPQFHTSKRAQSVSGAIVSSPFPPHSTTFSSAESRDL